MKLHTTAIALLCALSSSNAVAQVPLSTYEYQALYTYSSASNDTILFRSMPSFTQAADGTAGTKVINWYRREINPSTATWYVLKNSYTTRFYVSGISARQGGDEMYVAGVSPTTGNSIIERFDFPVRLGRWHHAGPTAPLVIGSPAGPYLGSTQIKGGAFIVPGSTQHIAPSRTVLIDSPNYKHIRAISADPEGRFLLFTVAPAGDLYRMNLNVVTPPGSPPTYSPQLIYDATNSAALTLVDRITVADHATKGRVHIAHPAKGAEVSHTIYVTDTNNDGVFDAIETVPTAVYESLELVDLALNTPVVSPWSAPWME